MFDPYHKWLGISKEEQPPTHYRLLGINATEIDPEVIEEAALRQMAHIRGYQIGPHAAQCTRLLNEISQARATLLDAAKRRAYDARLAEQQTPVAKPRPAAPTKRGRNLAVVAVVVGVVVLGGGLLVWSLTGNRDASTTAPNKEPIAKKPTIKDATAKKSKRPLTIKPLARWVFADNVRDTIAKLHGVLDGNPQFIQGKLRLGPTDRVLTAEIPIDITERTLEAFVSLPVNNQKTGIVMKIEQGDLWDGIIFSDFTPGRWTPGSSYRHRSTEFDIPAEPAGPSEVIQLATVYAGDNSIMLYRNGKVLGGPFTPQGKLSSLQTYKKGEARIQFGGGIVCDLIEARLYDRALTWKEIASSYQETVPETER